MKFLKKYWYFLIITIITIGLGIMTFLTSQQLTTTKPVAPNVAQEKPKASSAACTLTFTLATVNNTPTNTPTGIPTNTPVNTPTNTPTPTPLAQCNNGCTVNTDCKSGLICDGNACRNPSCTSKSSCVCDVPSTPTPTPKLSSCNNSCTVNTDCQSGLVCTDNMCRNPNCTEKTNCTCDIVTTVAPTPQTPVAGTGPSILGATVISGAFILILLGLAL